jgi:hypothetical protein
MKRKVGTIIEEEIIRLAKRRATEESRPLSDLIQDALVTYLSKTVKDSKKREAAYRIFCEQPIRITREQFDDILKEDAWDT